MKLVLASSSPSRQKLLKSAGIKAELCKPSIDEEHIKNDLKKSCYSSSAEQLAILLAELKAHDVSKKYSEYYVIGADQVLECEGKLFNKPENIENAKKQLLELKGKKHRLVNGLSIVKNNLLQFHFINHVTLEMRNFSEDFLENYLEKADKNIIYSVGSYHIEGLGAQLFSSIEGDYFSILGLPLLPLLEFLRNKRIILS